VCGVGERGGGSVVDDGDDGGHGMIAWLCAGMVRDTRLCLHRASICIFCMFAPLVPG